MANQSIIEHKANMYYLEFREDFLHLCLKCSYKKPVNGTQKSKASPYCKSFILAIMESWTNDKRGKGQDLGVYMTYPQWIESMYGMFGRSVIIDSLDELIGEGLISREAHRMFGKDTYKYYLNYTEVNNRIKSLEERDPNTTRPQVDASISKRVASTFKRDTRLLVDDDPSISRHNIDTTKKHNLETTESEFVATAHADVNAPTTFFVHPLHSFLSFDDLMTPTTMIISLTSKQFESEMEDDRRYRIAGEIEHALSAKGFPVKVQTTHDRDDVVVAANATPAPSEKTQETPAEQPEEKKTRKRAPRKSRTRTYAIPEEIKDRVEKVYAFLDKWRQDITGDPDEKFERNYESDEAVCSLFQGKPPTENKLRQVCEKMWNEPANPRTGYYERDHMTVKRICARYKSESLAMAVKEKPATTATPYSVGGYTYKPENNPTQDLPFAGPFRNRKKRGA